MKESPHSEEGTKCSKLHPACRPGLTLKEGTWASEHLVLLSWHCKHRDRQEPSESELSLHAALISWHERSIDKRQLDATRPPNPLRKERSLHLTHSAQRLQERDYRRGARSTPKKKYPHFLPIRCRCTHCLLGQPYLHMSPESREGSLSNRTAFSSAIMCRPIKAHAFIFSAETQDPNSINSPRTIGSFFRRKKKSSPCGQYFPGTFQCMETVRKRTLSHGSK